MNAIPPFSHPVNLDMLWDVLVEELNTSSTDPNLLYLFQSNIRPFLEKSNPKTNVLELNKRFLNQMLTAASMLGLGGGGHGSGSNPARIHIHSDTLDTDTVMDFNEFDQPRPAAIDFSDPLPASSSSSVPQEDKIKITSVESLLSSLVSQRNNDVLIPLPPPPPSSLKRVTWNDPMMPHPPLQYDQPPPSAPWMVDRPPMVPVPTAVLLSTSDIATLLNAINDKLDRLLLMNSSDRNTA